MGSFLPLEEYRRINSNSGKFETFVKQIFACTYFCTDTPVGVSHCNTILLKVQK